MGEGQQHLRTGKASFWTSKPLLITIAVGGVALIWLWPKHHGHLAVVLPYLVLLACPLMHLFHHHGHQDHASSSGAQDTNSERDGSRTDG